jgi:alpha-tubulin suppressor-like RCC1 family protein
MAKKIVKVMPNTDVTWSLSKDGFITQSGTLPDVLSAETIESFLEAGQGKFVGTKYSSWYLINGDLYGCGNGLGQGSGTTDTVLTYTKRASNVKDFAASGSSCFYIDNNNDLYGAGSSYYGQQGNGSTGTNVLTFTKLASNVKKVFASSKTSWYITESGDLYGCGDNTKGQQGSGDTTTVTTFTKRASNVKDFACCDDSFPSVVSWYITESGDLYGCGQNDYGQQGAGNTTNVTTFTKRASNVDSFSCSHRSAWYINKNGELYGCGIGAFGTQGTSDGTAVKTFTKRANNVKKVLAQGSRTVYLAQNGDLYATGSGSGYVFGNGSTGDLTAFTKIASNVKDFAFGNEASLYINQTGDLYVAGWNKDYGTIGMGTTENAKTYTKMTSGVKEVYCCEYDSWYIDNDGNLYGTGYNKYGQQGSGDKNLVTTFTQRASGLNGLTANLTINPTPSDATVVIDGEETTSKDVPQGKLIDYSVGKILFKTETGAVRLYEDKNLDITLSEEAWKQKENFKDCGVTYSAYGNNTYCDDTRFNNMWVNGYKNVTSAPTLDDNTYPMIKQETVTGLNQSIYVYLPKITTIKSFMLVVYPNQTTSNATCRVRVYDGVGSYVYDNKVVCNSVSWPLVFSKTGNFNVKSISVESGSNGGEWKSKLRLISLILNV